MIALHGVSHSWPGGEAALVDVSLEAAPGERIVILGANGSGKTTLLRVLAGLVSPAAGEVTWRGEPVTRESLRKAAFRRRFRADVGLLFQNAAAMLFHATVREEIAFGPRQLDHADAIPRAEAWAERLGIAGLLDRDPHALSAGEQKKVALAAVLATEPSVLLLDEPTASLDPRSTGRLVEFLLDQERTVIATTHNRSLARELGRRAVLLGEDHRVLRDGSVSALRDDPEALVAANLLHIHRHRHGDAEHRHWHEHDWD